ncbi:hypothetical protein [Anaerotignum propionicum]|uniref:hypothetical protein n=1 Tax=Anaerotignum propionicum TaxID=28446 RepID=UPI00289C1781|nr:hypothetical protein [Anaerotignum propionicum]
MEPKEIEVVEQIFDLKSRKEKREKRRDRKQFFSELVKCIFLLIVAMLSAAIIVPKSEAAPEKALIIYEFCAVFAIIILVSFWLDKPRRKK